MLFVKAGHDDVFFKVVEIREEDFKNEFKKIYREYWDVFDISFNMNEHTFKIQFIRVGTPFENMLRYVVNKIVNRL